jgi:RHS repeat-associated protein
LERDGQRSTEIGCALVRVDPKHYYIEESNGFRYEFTIVSPDEPARLDRIVGAEGALSLHYERIVAGHSLHAIGLGALGRLHITWGDGRIRSIALHESDPDRQTLLVSYRYDERGCLIEARNAYKHALRYDFDTGLRLAKKTDRRGYSFHFVYDVEGRCVESRGDDGAEAVKLQYRPIERSTLVTRHDGGIWSYQYNEAGSISNVLDPLGGMHATLFDDVGRVQAEIDPNGNQTDLLSDELGALCGKRDVFGHVLPPSYASGDPHPLDHRLAETPFQWEHGELFSTPTRMPSTEDPLWEVPPEARNRLQRADPAWGGQTLLKRNLQGLPISEAREDGKTRRWAFDENANLRWEIDFDGHKQTFSYRSDSHLASRVNALGACIEHEHTPTEQLSAITDACGTRSEYERDQKDRVVAVKRHGRVRESYAYDLADNLIEKRGADGRVLLQLTVGPGNRTTARKLASGEIQNFAYDARGRLVEARGIAGTCKLSYDYAGVRLTDLRDGRGVVHGPTSRGVGGIRKTTTVLGKFVTRFQRGRRGAQSVTDPTGRSHELRCLAPGVYQRTFSSGAREISQYDVAGRCLLKALRRGPADADAWVRRYELSGEGDLLACADSRYGTTRYTYDAAHRLVSALHPSQQADLYEYDLADNLVRMPSALRDARGSGIDERFGVQAGNRLAHAHGETFHYDDRDHVRRRDGWLGATEYRRDSLDQLVEIRNKDFTVHAEYDALGRRTQKSVNGRTTQYYWDSDRLAAELFPSGAVRIYVYAAPQALVPLLFVDYASIDADPTSGRRYFVASNHLGAVEAVTDDAGEVVWRAQLDPYGLAHVEQRGRFHQPLRFPGHYHDDETGLHYNRFRYYDPKLGRYLESDPIGIDGGINLYAYSTNPLRDVDLRGLTSKCPNSADCPHRNKAGEEGHPNAEGAHTPEYTRLSPAEIKAMPRGSRPDPKTYLSARYVGAHMAKFANGASRFMTKGNLDKYGPGQRDGTAFVLPKAEADAMVKSAKGDKRAMEKALGLPDKALDTSELRRVDIADPEALDVRVPSGNEAGASDLWLPGGQLPTGNNEAVVDLGTAPRSAWTDSPVEFD